ncbi:MAG: hypothetical protein ACOYJ1_13920 [Peptococcales bacterium]|jgi:hypothetical protein
MKNKFTPSAEMENFLLTLFNSKEFAGQPKYELFREAIKGEIERYEKGQQTEAQLIVSLNRWKSVIGWQDEYLQ